MGKYERIGIEETGVFLSFKNDKERKDLTTWLSDDPHGTHVSIPAKNQRTRELMTNYCDKLYA